MLHDLRRYLRNATITPQASITTHSHQQHQVDTRTPTDRMRTRMHPTTAISIPPARRSAQANRRISSALWMLSRMITGLPVAKPAHLHRRIQLTVPLNGRMLALTQPLASHARVFTSLIRRRTARQQRMRSMALDPRMQRTEARTSKRRS